MENITTTRRWHGSLVRVLGLALTLMALAAAGVVRPATASGKDQGIGALVKGEKKTVILTNGTGDAHATVEVDGFGSFGNDVYEGDGLVYDPVGPEPPTQAVFDSALWFSGRGKAGEGGLGSYLTGGSVGGYSLPAPDVTSDAPNRAVSSFILDKIRFDVTQELLPATPTGSILRQTYVLTNTSDPTSFDLIRHFTGDFDSVEETAGKVRNGQLLYQYSPSADPTNTPYLAIDLDEQADLGFQIAGYPAGRTDIYLNGRGAIHNTITFEDGSNADLNNDGVTDVAYDTELIQGRTFTLADGASATLVVNTYVGDGDPTLAPDGGTFTTQGNATGTGGVTVGDNLGRFNFVAVGQRNRATAHFNFTAPGVSARSQSIGAVRFRSGADYRSVEVTGTARVAGEGVVPFLLRATDRGQAGGEDTFSITFFPGSGEASYGGALRRLPGGRSDVVIRVANTNVR